MTKLVRARELIGRPVVTISGGDDIAEVKDVVYDPATHHLVGFTLNKRGWFRGPIRELLPTTALAAIGDTAVMVEDEHALTTPEDAPDDLVDPPSSRNVLGDRVITETGVDLGAVSDLIVMLDAGAEVVGYELAEDKGAHKFIPVDEQRAVSGAQVIVPEGLADFIRDDLSSFGCRGERVPVFARGNNMSELVTHAEGRKVVSRDDAEDVGAIKAFVLDDDVRRIVAVHVAGRERNAQLVDWEDITGFGPDAVVISGGDALHKVQEEREREMVRGDVPALGATVIDEAGDRQGVVQDLRFDPASGAVEAIVGDTGEWTPDDVRALGTFALVVRHR